MKVADLLKINRFSFEMMSKLDIKHKDWKFLELYQDYECLRQAKEKYSYIMAVLAEKYRISESTVKRVIKRLSREVIF